MGTSDTIQAYKEDIEYYRNSELVLTYTVTDAAGDPVDLSAKDLLMQVKNYRGDSAANALAELTVGSGLSIGGASNNVITFSGTYDIEQGTYYYDIWNTTDAIPIAYGDFKVTGDVSRAT
jgi:hypothetical protein